MPYVNSVFNISRIHARKKHEELNFSTFAKYARTCKQVQRQVRSKKRHLPRAIESKFQLLICRYLCGKLRLSRNMIVDRSRVGLGPQPKFRSLPPYRSRLSYTLRTYEDLWKKIYSMLILYARSHTSI